MKVLDHGYVKLIETWGSDESVISAARMSTNKGFLGWGTEKEPGDEKLLKYLWKHQHFSPFEFGGMIVEIKAPILVFREIMRHRVFSFNEASARYTMLPNENYLPTLDRLLQVNEKSTNKQASGTGKVLTNENALQWLDSLSKLYNHAQQVYENGIELGVAKELARLPMPVARYSKLRASANLRNLLGFLKLRMAEDAQWETRQTANAISLLVKEAFPRTYQLFSESK